MMAVKHFFHAIAICLLMAQSIMAQQSVGIGTTTPSSGTVLHVNTGISNRGFLVSGEYTGLDVPNLGSGTRLMYYPSKSIFRVGSFAPFELENQNLGYHSIAMGMNAMATQTHSMAFGPGSKSIGGEAAAIGSYVSAIGQRSLAMGYYSAAIGNYSIAMGGECRSTENYAISMGFMNQALGIGSLALGVITSANGYASTSLGIRTISKGYGSTVIGMFNDSVIATNEEVSAMPNTPLFIIGNGESNSNRSNAMVVQKNGHVGIGNIIPGFRLDVEGRMRLRGITGDPNHTAGIWLNNVNNNAIMGFVGVYSDNTMGFYGSGALWGLTMNTVNGNVGIGNVAPTQKLHVNGNVFVTGSVTQASDIRYKTNILPVSNVLSSILKVQPIYYNWKEDFTAYTSDRQLGFSAQEIEAQFPELVITDQQGYKSIDYSRMTPLLLQALKEQQRIIEKLEERISKMENR